MSLLALRPSKGPVLQPPGRVAGRITGMALTIVILCGALTLSGQQPQISSLSVETTAELVAGEALELGGVAFSFAPLLATNQPPIASFTFNPSRPVRLNPVSFDATSSSDPDGSITSYSWDFGDGSPVFTTTMPITTYSYASATTYTVKLNVTDNTENVGTVSKPVSVKSSNFAPVPIFTTTPPLADLFAGDMIFFDGSTSRDPDPDGDVVSYLWTLGDETSQAGPAAILHTYSSPGSYPVKLTVIDNSDEESSVEQSIWVRPALALAVSSNVTQGPAPLFISFNAQVSGGRFPHSFSWDFGDGRYSSIARPYHNYTLPRVYQVWVTVTDALGHTASKEMNITVTARPADLTFLGFSATTLKIGGALTALSVFPLIVYAAVRRRSNRSRNDA